MRGIALTMDARLLQMRGHVDCRKRDTGSREARTIKRDLSNNVGGVIF